MSAKICVSMKEPNAKQKRRMRLKMFAIGGAAKTRRMGKKKLKCWLCFLEASDWEVAWNE